LNLLKLSDVTLIQINCTDIENGLNSIQRCTKNVEFKEVKLITSELSYNFSKWNDILYQDLDIIEIPKISSIQDYSKFCIQELYKHFDTSHCLICQPDSWVVKLDAWTDEFLKYDYLGAVWYWLPKPYQGNGGFSLRSKKLQEIAGKSEYLQKVHPEDGYLSTVYNSYFESFGCTWAPFELCDRFAIESRDWRIHKSFGHHNGFGLPIININIPKNI